MLTIKTFQLKVAGVRPTLLVGKKFIINTLCLSVSISIKLRDGYETHSVKKKTEKILIGIPNFPKLHRRGRNGSLRILLIMIQLIETM